MRFFALLFLVLFSSLKAEPLNVKVLAKSAILINADSGAILYEKNAQEPCFPASTTKIASMLLVIKKNKARLDSTMRFPNQCLTTLSKAEKMAREYRIAPYYLEPDGSHFYMKRGEEMSIRNLLYGALLSSGNDASNILAYLTSGSIENFIKELNQMVRDLGCRKTHFDNPHGLHYPTHVTTAYDMAIIAKEAMKEPLFREIVNTPSYLRPKTNVQQEKEVLNNNVLLREDSRFFYDKTIGIKTGFTKNAGPTLVAAAKQEDRTLIAVLFGYQERADRFRDAVTLFEEAFREKKISRSLFCKKDTLFLKPLKGAKHQLQAGVSENVVINYYPSEEEKMITSLKWDPVKVPIKKDQRVGQIIVKNPRDDILLTIPLFAVEAVEKNRWLIKLAIIIALVVGVVYLFKKMLKFS